MVNQTAGLRLPCESHLLRLTIRRSDGTGMVHPSGSIALTRACVVRALKSCVPSLRDFRPSCVACSPAAGLSLAGCYSDDGYQLPPGR